MDLNFISAGPDSHADRFAIDYWVFEFEFMFAVRDACKNDSTHKPPALPAVSFIAGRSSFRTTVRKKRGLVLSKLKGLALSS